MTDEIMRPGLEPLCGWPWIEENKDKVYPEQGIEVFWRGRAVLKMPAEVRGPEVKRAIRELRASYEK